MIQMTPMEALDIQHRHIEHYGFLFPGGVEALRVAVKALTNLDGLEMYKPYPIIEINKRIPRGSEIETLVGINRRF